MIIEVNIGGQMLIQKEPKWKRCLFNLFPIVEWGTPFSTWPNWIESTCPCAYFHGVFDLHSLWGHYWLNRPSTPQAKFLVFAVIGLRVFFFFFFYHFCIRKQVGRVDYEEIMDSIHDRLFYLLLENVFQLKCLRVFVFNMVNI